MQECKMQYSNPFAVSLKASDIIHILKNTRAYKADHNMFSILNTFHSS